jgi:purine-binding chemotaxis protein CheW
MSQFVSFHVAGQILGIPVEQVQEILPPQPITNVPLASMCVSGLINLRGQIVTSLDIRIRLGLEPRNPESSFMNIIAGSGEELYSIVVDSVGDVITVEQMQFSPPPATLDPIWRQCCNGVYQLKQGLLISLDIKNLFNFASSKTMNAA